jgi:hypothetical protein
MSNNHSLTSNFTFDRVKAKLDRGQFLNEAEKQYLIGAAQEDAARFLDSRKSRGDKYLALIAEAVQQMAGQKSAPASQPKPEQVSETPFDPIFNPNGGQR